jgi:hypothetical protein
VAAEVVLPLADLPRSALHLGLEDFIGDPAQEIQGGSHCRAPRRYGPINHNLARRDVIAITGLRFPFNYLIYNDKMAQS